MDHWRSSGSDAAVIICVNSTTTVVSCRSVLTRPGAARKCCGSSSVSFLIRYIATWMLCILEADIFSGEYFTVSQASLDTINGQQTCGVCKHGCTIYMCVAWPPAGKMHWMDHCTCGCMLIVKQDFLMAYWRRLTVVWCSCSYSTGACSAPLYLLSQFTLVDCCHCGVDKRLHMAGWKAWLVLF